MRRAGILALAIVTLIGMQFCLSGHSAPSGNLATSNPRAAASSSYPGPGASLYAQNAYNLTGSIRNDANYNQTYESGNLEVTQDGNAYLNQSLTPQGTFAGDFSFENDKSGGLAAGITYDAGAIASVVESYLGHRKVLSCTGTGSWLYKVIDFSACVAVTVEYWFAYSNLGSGLTDLPVFLTDASSTIGFDIALTDVGGIDYLRYYNGTAAAWMVVMAVTPARWYHVSIYANSISDLYVLTVDGNVATDLWCYSGVSSYSKFKFANAQTTTTTYIDAITITPDATLGAYSSEQDFDEFAAYGDYQGEYSFADFDDYGHYAGLYSFTDVAIGSTPSGWTTTAGTFAQVNASVADHANVLNVTQSSWSYLRQDFTPQASGNIEFWVWVRSGYFDLALISSTGYVSAEFYLQYYSPTTGGIGRSLNDSSYVTISSFVPNTWIHFRVALNIAAGKWSLYQNGNYIGEYFNKHTAAENAFRFQHGHSGGNFYLDAVDYSWATGYSNGRSLSYNIANWNEEQSTGYINSSITVAQSFTGHLNVVNMTKASISSEALGFRQTFVASQTTGSIEFWLWLNVTSWWYYVALGGGNFRLYFYVDGRIRHYPGGVMVDTGYYFQQNAWNHFRMDFNTDADTWDVFANGTKILDDAACSTASSGITNMWFGGYATTKFQAYIDAVDYSWSTGFTPERNMCENITGLAYATGTTSVFTSVAVNASAYGHTNALWLNKSVTSVSAFKVSNTLASPQSSGTVEFWYYCNIFDSGTAYFEIREQLSNTILISFNGAGTVCSIGAGWSIRTLATISLNSWHHIRVSFDCVTGLHSVYIDGYLQGGDLTNYASDTHVDLFQLEVDAGTRFNMLLDSIDYSWNSGYALNRNWRTLPATDNKIDTTQLGVYNAMYSFESDQVFGVPAGWIDESGTNCTAYVIPEIQNASCDHRNLLFIEDQSAAGIANIYTTFAGQTSGTVSFWARTTNTTIGTVFGFYSSSTLAFYVYPTSGQWYANAGGSPVSLGYAYPNTWYYITIKFDTPTDKYSVYVNGMLKQSLIAFATATDPINKFGVYTGTSSVGYATYLDALDFSWDPAYSSERSSYLMLQQNVTFPSEGSYSYRFQAWSSGAAYSQAWTPFAVENNVQLVSESSATTRWVLANTEIATVWATLYEEDAFTSGNWYLAGVSETAFNGTWHTVTKDSYVFYNSPDTNFGSEQYVDVRKYDVAWHEESRAYFGYSTSPDPYLTSNRTSVWMKFATYFSNVDYYGLFVSSSTSWTETGLTWNNQPVASIVTTFYNAPFYYDYSDESRYAWNYLETGGVNATGTFSIQAVTFANDLLICNRSSAHPAQVKLQYSKFYQGGGLCYVQTNETESLALKSPISSATALLAGDRITVRCNATSTHQVNLRLLSGGATQQTLELVEEGNTQFVPRVETFTLASPVTFDQIDFTGIFDDGQYLGIDSITIERPSYVGAYSPVEQYVEPQGRVTLALVPGTYATKVYDGTQTVLDANATLATYSLNTVEYSPIVSSERQVNLFDQQGRLLPFESFRVLLNRTLNNITSPVNPDAPYFMTNNRFYADDDSYFNITVQDRFGQVLKTYTDRAIATFIDIQLTMHRLKIYNQAEKFCYVNISKSPDVGLYWSEWIAPSEVIGYDLYAGAYNVEVTNYENSSTQLYSYTLSGDDALLIGSENTIAQAIWNIQNTNVTLGNQITAVNISISNQASEINNSIVSVEINLSNVNSSLGTSLISIDSSLQSVNNTIGVNYVATNTSIYEIGSWINQSYNLLSAQAYLVNNSIYTTYAILDAGITSLNNNCNASFNTLVVKSDYLTYIFQNSMFSSTLNWSSTYDVTNDLVYGEFVNRLRNESLDVQVRYNNLTETLKMSALDSVAKYLPKSAEYRVWSVEKQEYLTEWETVNATMDLGWYEETVPISVDSSGWWLFGAVTLAYVGVLAGVAVYSRRKVRVERKRQDQRVLRGTSGGLFSEGATWEPRKGRR